MATNFSSDLEAIFRDLYQLPAGYGPLVKSPMPAVRDFEDGSGCQWLAYYEYVVADADDLPVVRISEVCIQGHDGGALDVPLRALSGKWLADWEYEIAGEVASDLEAAALALKEGA